MAISNHHAVHHHLRHRHVAVAKATLIFVHGTPETLTWRLPDGFLVTVDYPTAAGLCRLNICEGDR